MKKNKILWSILTVFFCFDAYLGWYFASYYIPKFAPKEGHAVVVDQIVVEKSLRKMTLFSGNKVVAVYDVSLGSNPVGNKMQTGDGKTPEGTYAIVDKHKDSENLYAIQISYPSKKDVIDARNRRVELSESIYIHGYPCVYPDWMGNMFLHGKDWTDGSIGLKNNEIEELWSYTQIGTKINIVP